MKKRTDLGGIGIVLLLVFLVVGGWVGYTIGRLYFDNETIKNEIGVIGDEAITSKQGDPKQKVANLLSVYYAKFDPEKISVEPSGNGHRITISVGYDRSADFLFTQFPFHFDATVQREGGSSVGVIQSVQDSLESSNNAVGQKYQKAAESAVKASGETTP